ncbi:sensor histidine kinase [Paenibacillus tarimensis]
MQLEREAAMWGLLGCALFFAFYFLSPLFRHRPAILFLFLFSSLTTAVCTFSLLKPAAGEMAGMLFLLLMISYLMGEAGYRLSLGWTLAFGAVASAAMLAAFYLENGVFGTGLTFAALYLAAFVAAIAAYHRERTENREGTVRFEALLDEYRKLKRYAKSSEDAARIEERTTITRQIHDSVGHKLTSLLMQLEMFRMNSTGEIQLQAEQMKRLAQESLDETRKAVKALKEAEPGGIPALLRLIRNLEAENYLQVEFSFRHGALSVALRNDQSIAVYRAIQEALTNAMRHGSSRKVSIRMESPGGRIFRFEVVSDIRSGEREPVREGFGLTSMRDRIEKAGGELDVTLSGGQFLVRGTFKLEDEKEREKV